MAAATLIQAVEVAIIRLTVAVATIELAVAVANVRLAVAIIRHETDMKHTILLHNQSFRGKQIYPPKKSLSATKTLIAIKQC